MSKAEIKFDATFTDVTDKGYGVCRAPDGRTVFVADALTGERAAVKVIKEYKTYMIGKVEELYERSPHRIEVDCDVFRRCGGCVYRHVDYMTELELKRKGVEEQLRRNGGLSLSVPTPIHGNDREYRNKLLLPVGKRDGQLMCGFFAAHSHSITPCTQCKLHTEDFALVTNKLLQLLKGKSPYDESSGKGLLRHIYLRRNKKGRFAVTVIVNGKRLPSAAEIAQALMEACPNVKSFYVNLNVARTNTVTGPDWVHIAGDELLKEELCGKTFYMSPAAFFQVNTEMTEKLYATAAAFADIKEGEIVFDMYCGIGTVGLSICPDNAKLCGVEIVPKAIENARINAAANGRTEENTRFYACDATEGFRLCRESFGKDADVVLVDPPRAGLTPELIGKIAASAPDRVVYISCNPATLARDLKLFAEAGYKVQKLQTVDMFPRTGHVETVALLSRQKVTEHIYIDVDIADLPKTTRTTATYPEIKAYIKDKYGLCVSSLNIAQIKEKHGFEKRENYNKGKEGHRVPKCPPEKEKAIEDAFKHFGML